MRRDVKLSDRIRNPRVIRIKGTQKGTARSFFEFDVKPWRIRGSGRENAATFPKRKFRSRIAKERIQRRNMVSRTLCPSEAAKLEKIGSFVIYN